jgi:phosphoglycolate phosphatase-like HAD superfamily hydrolase
VYPNALVKVAASGLEQWLDLSVGAYGSDEHDRNLLVPIAMTRVAEHTGWHVDPDQVWVIGDTPADLECARAVDVRCLLVATGRYPVHSLENIGADVVLANLCDTAAVLKFLIGS